MATVIVIFVKLEGGAAYYFTNVAFFVSLPFVIILFTDLYSQIINEFKCKSCLNNIFLLLIIFAIFYISLNVFQRTHQQHLIHKKNENQFIASLLSIRKQPLNNLYVPSEKLALMGTPVKECVSQPFVYPAVSERPWMNVIAFNDGCFYEFYGFRKYGITLDQQKEVTVAPRTLDNMEKIFWP